MGRFAFVARRLLVLIPLLLGVVLMVFLLLKVTPGDPARVVAGQRASEEDVARVREDLGLDDSVLTQYGRYVSDVVQGDLGYSLRSRQPVATVIRDRLEPTAWLVVGGLLVSLVISLPLGV